MTLISQTIKSAKTVIDICTRQAAAQCMSQLHAKAIFQTTSFLDATILIYAIGAGITAAAGTRLALQ